jgi:hypothetical protein
MATHHQHHHPHAANPNSAPTEETNMTEQTASTPLTKAEWEALYDKIFDHSRDRFFESLEKFHRLNWPVQRLVAWILRYYNLTLNQQMVDAVASIEQETTEEYEAAYYEEHSQYEGHSQYEDGEV